MKNVMFMTHPFTSTDSHQFKSSRGFMDSHNIRYGVEGKYCDAVIYLLDRHYNPDTISKKAFKQSSGRQTFALYQRKSDNKWQIYTVELRVNMDPDENKYADVIFGVNVTEPFLEDYGKNMTCGSSPVDWSSIDNDDYVDNEDYLLSRDVSYQQSSGIKKGKIHLLFSRRSAR